MSNVALLWVEAQRMTAERNAERAIKENNCLRSAFYTPTGPLGGAPSERRRTALERAFAATPEAEQDTLRALAKRIEGKYDNAGKLISLEVLAAIGLLAEREGIA